MRRLWPLIFLLCWARVPTRAQQGTLLVSELLYQPFSGEAEYVELFNPADTAVDLAGFRIVRVLHDSLAAHYPLPHHTVAPHSYVVLTGDAASVASRYDVRYPSRVVECSLPPYPNSGGSVVVATPDTHLVDRLDYTPAMHSRLLRNKAGVSLERRSFERPASEASNWFSASSTSGYGTPGYANSQSTELLAEERSFAFSSTLLSPDGDGYQDCLEIEYTLDEGAEVGARAEVYDARGRQVRRLLNNVLLGTSGRFAWDGRDADGRPVPRGQYIIQITLYDTHGTRQSVRRTVAVVE